MGLIPNEVRRGDTLTEFPGNSWNALVASYWGGRSAPPAARSTGASRGQSGELAILVRNDTDDDIEAGGILAMDGITAADEFKEDNHCQITLASPVVKGCKPEPGRQFGVVREKVKPGEVARMTITGTAWTKIDVVSEDHKTAETIEGDAGKMRSAEEGPYPIIWKEDGTGEKHAAILMGSGGGGGATARLARTLEHIDSSIGYLNPEDPEEGEERGLLDEYKVSHGKVRPFAVKSEDENAPPPADENDLDLVEVMQDVEVPPDQEPADPPEQEPREEIWHNPLMDAILKNSIVLGITAHGKTMIMAVSPTTIKKEPEGAA